MKAGRRRAEAETGLVFGKWLQMNKSPWDMKHMVYHQCEYL